MVIAYCCIFKPRCFFLFLCYLQLFTLIARQTFDFFGHLWLCILVNFFTILIVIIGIFGGHQYRPGYISIYLLWQIINITWNVFIICFYLDIGPYTQTNSGDYNLVNLGTGSRSWFEANGPLCNAIYNVSNLTDHLQLIKPVQVNGCYLDYRIIECVQAGIQILFAINTFFISFFLVYSFSRKPYSTGNRYNHGLNGHASNIDATLPPYTISNTINSRPSVVQRSIRSVQSQSLRKHTANRSSTRSTKSHRSAKRNKQHNNSNHLPNYSSNYPNGPNYSTANPYNTLNSNSNNYNSGYYNTYKSIKSYNSNHHSGGYNTKQYNSTTQLQPDSSSVDSLTLYGAQTNQGYYESKYSLHKSDKEQSNGTQQPLVQSTSQNYQPNSMQRLQQSDYYEATPSNYPNNNSLNNNYDTNTQSNYYSQTPYQKSSQNNQDSIYNVYSSNPYNTYGRSTTRHQQRPSSFSSTTSCNSLMDNMITNNPNGNSVPQYSSHHQFENVNLRASPVYMNSETRI